MILPAVIFALSYALIASRRLRWIPLGRPAGALLGATAMIAFGVLTPKESYAALDHDTLVLLFAMMALTAYLERAGLFERLAQTLIARSSGPLQLLAVVALSSGALSAVLVNDTVCVFFTPVVVLICERARLPMGPYLVALATSSNIGCAATLVGNPQNMIIGNMSGISFLRFLACVGPAALVALFANLGLLVAYYRRALPASFAALPPPAPVTAPKLKRTLAVSFAILGGFVAGLHLGYTALAGVVVLMLLDRDEPRFVFERMDWTLLVFFCGLFVLVAGFAKTGLVELAWRSLPSDLATFTGIVTVGSNLVSNVPLVLLTGPHVHEELRWMVLAYASTVAGNLTLVGSAANIIVAERAKHAHTLGFFEHFRFGAISCALSLAVGVPIVMLMCRLLGI